MYFPLEAMANINKTGESDYFHLVISITEQVSISAFYLFARHVDIPLRCSLHSVCKLKVIQIIIVSQLLLIFPFKF